MRYLLTVLCVACCSVLIAADDAAKTGTLSGRILYDGKPPPLPALDVPTTRTTLTDEKYESAEFKRYAGLGLKDETLEVSKTGGLKNAVIWISDKRVPIPPLQIQKETLAPAALAFVGGKLQPQVLVWWAPERQLELDSHEPYFMNLRLNAIQSQAFNRLLPPKKSVSFPVNAAPRPVLVRSDGRQTNRTLTRGG